jgi:alkylated DNA repair dioxygenase AlkB
MVRVQAAVMFGLLREPANVPWKQRVIRFGSVEHPLPRLTAWFGDPGTSYTYSGIHENPEPWTSTLLHLRNLVEQATGEWFNSCLATLYRSGDDHVSWHADDEPELGSTIASLSLGAARRFKIRGKAKRGVDLREERPRDVALDPGSLLIMGGTMQQYWEHCVPRQRGAGERINLTWRRVV